MWRGGLWKSRSLLRLWRQRGSNLPQRTFGSVRYPPYQIWLQHFRSPCRFHTLSIIWTHQRPVASLAINQSQQKWCSQLSCQSPLCWRKFPSDAVQCFQRSDLHMRSIFKWSKIFGLLSASVLLKNLFSTYVNSFYFSPSKYSRTSGFWMTNSPDPDFASIRLCL